MVATEQATAGAEGAGDADRASLAGALPGGEFSLLDLANRLLDKGVVATGEATISVAGIDLVYLGLNLALSSVETIRRGDAGQQRHFPWGTHSLPHPLTPSRGEGEPWSSAQVAQEGETVPSTTLPAPLRGSGAVPVARTGGATGNPGEGELGAIDAIGDEIEQVSGALPERVNVDPDSVEQGLAKLVLTLVEFLRQVLERQAVRRMEGGDLSEEQVERLGLALLRLEQKMRQLTTQFGLQPEELNINLGPLGTLL